MATRHLALVAGITRHSDLGPAVAASLHRRGARVVALCADEQAERRLRAVVGAAAPGLGVVIAARAPATVGELYADPVAHALEGVGLAARGTAFDVVFHEQCGTVREAAAALALATRVRLAAGARVVLATSDTAPPALAWTDELDDCGAALARAPLPGGSNVFALHFAAARDDLELARALLARAGAGAGVVDAATAARGETPLWVAARFGGAGVAALLLDAGANVEARRTNAGGATPLIVSRSASARARARALTPLPSRERARARTLTPLPSIERALL